MKGANPKTPEVLALWELGDLTTKQVAEAAGVTYSVAYAIITRGIRNGRSRPRKERTEQLPLQTLCRRYSMGVGYFGRQIDELPTKTAEMAFQAAISGGYASLSEYAVDVMISDVFLWSEKNEQR